MEIPTNADGQFIMVDPQGQQVGSGTVLGDQVVIRQPPFGASVNEIETTVTLAEVEALFDDPPFQVELRAAP